MVNEVRATVVIANEVVHFRPLAQLRQLASSLDVELFLTYKGETLPVSRILALIGWELRRGDEVELLLRSTVDKPQAMAQVVEFIEHGFGEKSS